MSKILVLKRCIEGGKAYNGFIYPKAGEVVEAEDWEDSEECGDGLHGWTEDKWEYYDFKLKGNWVVLEVNKEDGFVELGDKVKFRKGKVLYNGESLDMAKELMLKQYPKMVFHFDNQKGGDYSTQTAGAYSTQTAWHNSTQKAGSNSTQTAGSNSTQTALYSSTQTAGYSSTQTAGDYSTQTAGSYSTQTAGDNSTQKAGSNSTQTAGYDSTQTAGDDSTQKAWYSSTQTAGAYSTQTAWHNSTQTAGDNSFICHYVYDCYNIIRPSSNSIVSSINVADSIASSFISNRDDVTYVINSKCKIEKQYTTTPDNIDKLEKFEIIVFGSNLNGDHAGGLARVCVDKFGAKDGICEGITGQCYAFPTLGRDMKRVSKNMLEESVQKLIEFANTNTGKVILLTKVGCGIAGFEEDYIKHMFENLPANIIKPKGW